MMKVSKVGVTVAAWGIAVGTFLFLAASTGAQSAKEKQLVTLVDQAVNLINSEGSAAFPRFHKKGTMWRESDTYIFVGDTDGTILVNGGNPSLEGQNLFEQTDVNGKPFVQTFIETVTTKGAGWVGYMWPKPGQATPKKKMSYVKQAKMGEKTLFVGAGFYRE